MRSIPRKLIALLFSASLVGLTVTNAQTYEDEWYDPTDWFDSNNYEYDDNLGLDYSYWDDETDTFGSTDWGYENDGWATDNEAWGTDNSYWGDSDWGMNDDEGIGGSGIYDEGYGAYDGGYDWGFNRGYGTQSSWQNDKSSQQGQGASGSSQSGSSKSKSMGKQCSVSGTIERVRNLNMRDRQDQSTRLSVAQVELQDGRDVLVAFKTQPQQRQRQLNLQPGQQIQARGKVGVISGRRVLMADQLRKNGRTFDVRQISSQRSQGSGSPGQFQSGSSQQQQPERGQVRGSRRVRSSQGDEHTLLLIQFENGRTALVDLGPNSQF